MKDMHNTIWLIIVLSIVGFLILTGISLVQYHEHRGPDNRNQCSQAIITYERALGSPHHDLAEREASYWRERYIALGCMN